MPSPEDILRLERYDAFAASVRADLADVKSRMVGLRAQGRAKTATYQQLMANKLVLEGIIERLEDCGL